MEKGTQLGTERRDTVSSGEAGAQPCHLLLRRGPRFSIPEVGLPFMERGQVSPEVGLKSGHHANKADAVQRGVSVRQAGGGEGLTTGERAQSQTTLHLGSAGPCPPHAPTPWLYPPPP